MTYLQEYYEQITNGNILVGKKIKNQIEKLVYLIEHPEENYIIHYDGTKEYFEYDESYAERPIAFIETFCKHVEGSEYAGNPIKLELWQKAMISALYGFIGIKSRHRKHRRLHLYIGRKNGKTLIAGCIIIYEMLLGGERGAKCYTGATKRDQAKIAWDMVKLIIKQSPVLSRKFDITINGIYLKPFRDTSFLPLSKESKKMDGKNVHFSHIDELHAITDSNIIDVLWDGTKSRTQPIEFITTTMGTERQSTFDEIYDSDSNVLAGDWKDPRLLVFCYELDKEEEWKDIKNAWKANPNLGVSQSINQFYEEVEKAKDDKKKLINLLCKSFNVRQNSKHSWLTYDELDNKEVYDLEDFRDQIVIGGFDLSRTGDLTAFNIMMFDKKKEKIVNHTMYWATTKYVKRTVKVPMAQWVKDGYVRESGSELIDYHDVVDYVQEIVAQYGFRFMYIHYDSYSAGYLINDLESLGYSKDHVLIKTFQGAKTLSIPMQEFEANLKQKVVSYQNNPVTKWCLSNVELEKDRNGNYMPKKGSYERKIDGVATILNCYVGYIKNRTYFMTVED